jgi:hypothetical protein
MGEIGLAAIKEAGLQPHILPELLASELLATWKVSGLPPAAA